MAPPYTPSTENFSGPKSETGTTFAENNQIIFCLNFWISEIQQNMLGRKNKARACHWVELQLQAVGREEWAHSSHGGRNWEKIA